MLLKHPITIEVAAWMLKVSQELTFQFYFRKKIEVGILALPQQEKKTEVLPAVNIYNL